MNVIISSIDFILNWSRANSLWPLTFATSCCGIEMMQTVASNNDIARFGSEVFRGSPRQADLLICAGTITHKMAPALLRLYEQMPEPKYVIAMGACTCGGGMFAENSYSVIRGIDKIIPVDVYLPMCPPKPEALLDAIKELQDKIKQETLLERKVFTDKHISGLKEDCGMLIENDFSITNRSILNNKGGINMDLEELKRLLGNSELIDGKVVIKSDLAKTIDFIKNNYGFNILKEITAVDTTNGIELSYRLYSVEDEEEVIISIVAQNEAESISKIFDSAVADEKEIFDMFGINFI